MLEEFKYLRGVPVLRAIHDNTVKPERIRRQEDAPRPELPTVVAEGLDFDEAAADADVPDEDDIDRLFADEGTEERSGTFSDLF